MRRRLRSLFGAVLVAATVVGFDPVPAEAAPGALTMQGPVEFASPPPITGPWCTSFGFQHTWLISTTAYAGPMPVDGTGSLCGTIPGLGTGSISVVGNIDVAGITATLTCVGSWAGTLPGTMTFHLRCTLTVTTPFTNTTTDICADGIVTLQPYIIGILAGAGVTPC